MKKNSSINIRKGKMPRICQTVIIFFFIGMLLGTLVGKLFNSALLPELKSIYTETLSSIPSLDIPSDKIVLSSFYRNIKFVLLLFIFSMTDLWRYYCLVFSVYTGFSNSLLLFFNISIYKFAGIANYTCCIMPQYLIFVPSFLYIIMKLHKINSCDDTNQKGKLFLKQFPLFLLSILLILIGSLAEGYINPLLLSHLAGAAK